VKSSVIAGKAASRHGACDGWWQPGEAITLVPPHQQPPPPPYTNYYT